MAGIYIHIPFCRQACHYCDFHFSTNLKNQSEVIQAICEELILRKGYLNEQIETIYFGGGTPSLLSSAELMTIISTLRQHYDLSSNAEVTLEANPEDLTPDKSMNLKMTGINRLSIGIQTLNDKKLHWMNRIHNVSQVYIGFKNARQVGFKNISLDLIYAIPEVGMDEWKHNLERVTELNPEHISIYGLTIERKTVFEKWKQAGKLIQMPEDEAATQYLFAINFLSSKGFEHYEVSNFGKPKFHSRHNNSYWAGERYLGVGPGAHSFDGRSRQFNVMNNAKYLKGLKTGTPFFKVETLSKTQQVNEKILTRLRGKDGLDLKKMETESGFDFHLNYRDLLTELKNRGLIMMKNNCVHLTSSGFLVADEIALRMFFPE